MHGTDDLPGLAMARSIRGVVREHAAEAERLRTLPPAVVDALWSSGLMRWMNPREAGGRAPSVRDMLATWKELAWQDASTGWIGIANFPSAAFAAAYLPEGGFEEIFGRVDDRSTTAGQFFPNGVGQPADGGWRVSGAWSFGSGTGHAPWISFGFFPMRDGAPMMGEDELPVMLVGLAPRDEVRFTDGWHVQGLKGTGSYDYELRDVLVPEHRTYPLFTRTARRGGALYGMGIMPIVAAGHAAWALGVARSALDDVRELAAGKARMGEPTSLAAKPTFQRDLAHHEGMWRAADRLVTGTFVDVTDAVLAGGPLTPAMRADLRIAASYATQASRAVVEWCHLACGTTAIREGSRLERAFRDIYTGTQHAFVSEKTYVDAAQVLLGLVEDVPGL